MHGDDTKRVQNGYLARLPPTHEALVEQERRRLGRVMSGISLDLEGLRDRDNALLVLILADLGSSMGRALADIFDRGEAMDEYQRASAEGRRPVVVEGLKGHKAIEFLQAVLPEALEGPAPPMGSFLLLVIDQHDDPCSVFVVPTLGLCPEGAIH
jgi:hypothetical protein